MSNRYIALWAAYFMLIVGGVVSSLQIQASFDSLSEQVCRVVLIDLSVELAFPSITPEEEAAIRAALVEVEDGCDVEDFTP